MQCNGMIRKVWKSEARHSVGKVGAYLLAADIWQAGNSPLYWLCGMAHELIMAATIDSSGQISVQGRISSIAVAEQVDAWWSVRGVATTRYA